MGKYLGYLFSRELNFAKIERAYFAGLKFCGPAIKEFLQYVTESRVEDMNEHWMPFYELCQPCAVSYDFIGSFENLEADATQALKELNVNEQVSFPKQQKYYQPGGSKYTDSKSFADASPALLRTTLIKYALDYKMFSYQIPKLRKQQ